MTLTTALGGLGYFFDSWFVNYRKGNPGSPAASLIFMAVSLLVSAGLTLVVRPRKAAMKPKGNVSLT